jgi:hypothetical protein
MKDGEQLRRCEENDEEPFVLSERGSDLARFYELAYQIGDHWLSAHAHLKRALSLLRTAEAIFRERIEAEHPDNDVLATIEMASLFPYFEERYKKLVPILDEILQILKMDDLPTVFAVDTDTPQHCLRRNYSLIMMHLVRDRIERTQRQLLPFRLFDLCMRSDEEPHLDEVVGLYQSGDDDEE